MDPELTFIKTRNLNQKETFEFYINIGYNPTKVLLKMGINVNTSYEKLCECIKIINEGWYPDWKNESEYKWMNYFRMKGVFSYYNTYYYNSITTVPSALCLKSEELAEYAKSKLIELYKEVYE